MKNQKITPNNITKLKKNEIFVFGSNLLGNHAGGAARFAAEKFGAINGQGIGLQGKSYALPTLDTTMDKLSLKQMASYVSELQVCAINNPKLTFLITEVGCGIAGFTHQEVAPLFASLAGIDNFALPQAFVDVINAPVIVKGFKGFDAGLVCNPGGNKFQYAENSEFTMDKNPLLCNHGFHFCEQPLDVFNYYPPSKGREYATVEAFGETQKEGNKTATNKLRVNTKLSIGNLFKLHFDLVFDKIKADENTLVTAGSEAHANTAGNYAHANTAGSEAHANTAGNYAHANTAGSEAHANTAGSEAHANTAGNYAHANTAGNYAHANTAGNYAHANTAGSEAHANTAGNYAHASVKGPNSIASSLGVMGQAKGSLGCWIVVTEWKREQDYSWSIVEVKATKVDGDAIKPDTFYKLQDGQFIEA